MSFKVFALLFLVVFLLYCLTYAWIEHKRWK